jgi:hypothetical protein
MIAATTAVLISLTSPDGSPMVGATVTARLSGIDLTRGVVPPAISTAKTDADGHGILSLQATDDTPGSARYSITIAHPGAKTSTRTGLQLQSIDYITLRDVLRGIRRTPGSPWDDTQVWSDLTVWPEDQPLPWVDGSDWIDSALWTDGESAPWG